jgi:hypothetical protein
MSMDASGANPMVGHQHMMVNALSSAAALVAPPPGGMYGTTLPPNSPGYAGQPSSGPSAALMHYQQQQHQLHQFHTAPPPLGAATLPIMPPSSHGTSVQVMGHNLHAKR